MGCPMQGSRVWTRFVNHHIISTQEGHACYAKKTAISRCVHELTQANESVGVDGQRLLHIL